MPPNPVRLIELLMAAAGRYQVHVQLEQWLYAAGYHKSAYHAEHWPNMLTNCDLSILAMVAAKRLERALPKKYEDATAAMHRLREQNRTHRWWRKHGVGP